MVGPLLLGRSSQQAQFLAQLHMVTSQISERWRKIMNGYGGHGIGTPLLRRDRLTIGFQFEPEDRGSQDAALRREIADLGSTVPRSSPTMTAPARYASKTSMLTIA